MKGRMTCGRPIYRKEEPVGESSVFRSESRRRGEKERKSEKEEKEKREKKKCARARCDCRSKRLRDENEGGVVEKYYYFG